MNFFLGRQDEHIEIIVNSIRTLGLYLHWAVARFCLEPPQIGRGVALAALWQKRRTVGPANTLKLARIP